MKKLYAISQRDTKGMWHELGTVEAQSSAMARNIAYRRIPSVGRAGECETHRVKAGWMVYEYSDGAICVKLV